jgi:hypothetical protein
MGRVRFEHVILEQCSKKNVTKLIALHFSCRFWRAWTKRIYSFHCNDSSSATCMIVHSTCRPLLQQLFVCEVDHGLSGVDTLALVLKHRWEVG